KGGRGPREVEGPRVAGRPEPGDVRGRPVEKGPLPLDVVDEMGAGGVRHDGALGQSRGQGPLDGIAKRLRGDGLVRGRRELVSGTDPERVRAPVPGQPGHGRRDFRLELPSLWGWLVRVVQELPARGELDLVG